MNERSVFLAALDIADSEARTSYLREACGADADLQRGVEELLHASEQAGSFMEGPAATLGATKADTTPDCPIELNFLAASDQPGSLGRLGAYEILRVIGQGGMGIVLAARDTRLERVVAVKVLAPQLAASAAARQRFQREAKAAAAIRDEHVVTIYAVEEAFGLPYLVMELINGMSLQERIDKDGSLAVAEILRIGAQTARGLSAAHAHGLIHRDVKPANILLENGVERVKLTDFGLARVADDASLSQSGLIAGTPHYMAPEQARAEAIDHRADLFSLGSVLYAMCIGRPPFRATTTLGVLKRVCEERLGPIRDINPDIPEWLVAAIEKLHAKNPAERYPSAAEVVDLLSRYLAEMQQSAIPIVENARRGVPPKGREPATRRRLWPIALIVLMCLGLAVVITEAIGRSRIAPTLARLIRGERAAQDRVDSSADSAVASGDVAPSSGGEAAAPRREVTAPPSTAAIQPPIVRQELRQFEGNQAVVWSVAFSPDGSRALSGCGGQFRDGRMSLGSDFTVRLWDVAAAQQIHAFTGHQHQVQSVAFTTDGRHVVGASKIWAWRMWDVATGHELPGFRGNPATPFFYLTLSDDATRLLSFGGKDKVLRLWDVPTESELWKFEGLTEDVSAAAFSPDGRKVATAGGGRFDPITLQMNSGSDNSIRLWDALSGKEDFRLRGHASFVRGLAFLPGERRLISGGADNVLRLWDLQTHEELHVYRGHSRGINAIALSPDGRWALSGSADTTVRLWDIETGQELCRYEGHTGEVRTVACSPDGRYALSGGYDETVRLWQLPEK